VIVLVVSLGIDPDGVGAFEAAMRINAAASRREPGCRRFEVYRDRTDPTRFHLFEVYDDAEARAAHRMTPHFLHYQNVARSLIVDRAATEYDVDEIPIEG